MGSAPRLGGGGALPGVKAGGRMAFGWEGRAEGRLPVHTHTCLRTLIPAPHPPPPRRPRPRRPPVRPQGASESARRLATFSDPECAQVSAYISELEHDAGLAQKFDMAKWKAPVRSFCPLFCVFQLMISLRVFIVFCMV